ncbi:MAG: 2-dehydropantoate 2-reductase N-terminal domain-containing protein, partial [Gaiellaceae bacterium]
MTRVCVAGVGVIGSLFAGYLARVSDVSALTRREDHARALNEEGLRVSGRGDFVSRVRAATTPGALPEPDLVIVASKGGDVDRVAGGLEGCWPDAIVMTVQNGIGADEIVARHGAWRLLS